ncbi:MAG: MBL fold metallo-hydrolase [Lachnospiraceae bacterium]|nr:MBL fold metallo-hydrolase [Lachnospiraceae bacterium]
MKRIAAYIVTFFMICVCGAGISGCSQSEMSKQGVQDECMVHFIDVGQGDAALIQIDGKNSLIDTGTNAHYDDLSFYLNEQGVEKIDNMIVTHPDADHMGSAYKIIQEYSIDNFYTSDAVSESQAYKKMIKALKDKRLEKQVPEAGDVIDFGTGSEGTLLGPIGETRDNNESSLVIRLDYGDTSFLFTGDTTARMENKMNETYDIDVDVLKASHHGSDTANGIMFIRDVSPVYSVISVGADNHYGHPDRNVLRRLEKYTSEEVLRTDEMGSIIIMSDGKNLSVESYEDGARSNLKDQSISKSNANTTADSGENGSEEKVIGNRQTKVYHAQDESNLPAEKNRIYFDSVKDAEQQGYRACERCYQ